MAYKFRRRRRSFRRRSKTHNKSFRKFSRSHKRNRTRLQFRGGIRL